MVEQVAVAVGVRELGRDVLGQIDVDDAVPARRRAEEGEVPTAALLDLHVEAGAAACEGADDLAHEALPLHLSHPRHHRQPGVQVQGQRVVPCLDHEPFHAHLNRSAARGDLKHFMGQTAYTDRRKGTRWLERAAAAVRTPGNAIGALSAATCSLVGRSTLGWGGFSQAPS